MEETSYRYNYTFRRALCAVQSDANSQEIEPTCCWLSDHNFKVTKRTEKFVFFLSIIILNAAYNFMVNREELFGTTHYIPF